MTESQVPAFLAGPASTTTSAVATTLGPAAAITTSGTIGGGLKPGSLGTPSTGGVRPGHPTQLNLTSDASSLAGRRPTLPNLSYVGPSSSLPSMTSTITQPTLAATNAPSNVSGPASSIPSVTSLGGQGGKLQGSGTTVAPGSSDPAVVGQPAPTTGPLASTTTTTGSRLDVPGAAAGAGPSASKKYTYQKLENLVNRWSREMQDQEKMFLQQAALVGQWDTMLQKNGERIITLNEQVEKALKEQNRLDNELDLIDTQQNELEEVLVKLEEFLSALQPLPSSQHADAERDYTYSLVNRIDCQLTQMGKDLSDVIEQMNAAGSSDMEDDHMSHIVQILNAHADTLNWIDRNTVLVQQKVDEVSTMVEKQRLEHERSFHMAFGQPL